MVFSVLAARLVQLQVVRADDFERIGAKQRIRTFDIPAKRGAIFDRSMTPFAVSTEARDIIADPAFVDDPIAGARALAPVLGVSESRLREKLTADGRFVYLARKVPPQVAAAVANLELGFTFTQRATERSYPSDRVAGQVLGFVGLDDEGLAGLEFSWDEVLRGTPGQEIVEQDPAGRPIPHGRHSIREPVPGRGLVLTIDRDIQFMAEQALVRGIARTNARGGVAVVLDPGTGDVLAMANAPTLDPDGFGAASPARRRNRAVTDSYEPGSVNKVITAAAALEAGLVTPATVLTVPDRIKIANRTFRDYQSHPTEKLTYAEALARSSNVATIAVAQQVGAQRLDKMLRRFGFGKPTGVGFPGESPGIHLPLEQWYGTSMGTIPIGQGIAVTPLQIASVYATIANGGVRVAPRLVSGTVEHDGSIAPVEPAARRRVIASFTAAQMRAMLVGVVEDGTGSRAQIPGYVVGGKTGTARVPYADRPGYSNDIVTTFVGIAPADAPRLVVLVSLDNPRPRFASLTAAPVWREITAFALSKLGVVPSVVRPDDASLLQRRAEAPPRPTLSASPSPSLRPRPSTPARTAPKEETPA